MEPEKLEKLYEEYKDASGIALLNAYSSGVFTREEYKLIQRFKKEGMNDVKSFLEKVSKESTKNADSVKDEGSIIVPSILNTSEGTKNVPYQTEFSRTSDGIKNEEESDIIPTILNTSEGTKNVPYTPEKVQKTPGRGTKNVPHQDEFSSPVDDVKNDEEPSVVPPILNTSKGTKNVYLTPDRVQKSTPKGYKNVPHQGDFSPSGRGTKNVPHQGDFSPSGRGTKNVPLLENEGAENFSQLNAPRKTTKVDSYQNTNDLVSGLSMVSINSNFTKLDNGVSDCLNPLQTPTEQSIYNRLYRLAVGWNRNYCRVKNSSLMTDCNIKDKRTLNTAIDGLILKGHIELINRNRGGSLYRIFFPGEVLKDGKNLPIFYDNGGTKNVPLLVENSANDPAISRGTKNVPLPNPPKYIFKDNKDLYISLSPGDLISRFYENVGQKNITKAKRESAKKNLEELASEGFTPEDVSFAIEWTLENLKDQPYDFSILKHTISQAMAEKKKTEEKQERLREQEQTAMQEKAEEERLEKERVEIEALKEKLNPEERAKLRQRAIEQINKMEGIKQDFVTESLIRAKENEILKHSQ